MSYGMLTSYPNNSGKPIRKRNARTNSIADPEQWRGALERSAATIIVLKAGFQAAVEVLKSTYNDRRAFEERAWDDRFWTPPKLLHAPYPLHAIRAIRRSNDNPFMRRVRQ